MEEAHLQGNSALLAQVECLQLPVGGPVPHVDAGAIQTWNTSRGADECWSATVKTQKKALLPLDWFYQMWFTSGLTFCHVGHVKAVGQGFRSPPLSADHHVVSWLVPEVVPKWRRLPGVLPVTHHLKGLAVQQYKAT